MVELMIILIDNDNDDDKIRNLLSILSWQSFLSSAKLSFMFWLKKNMINMVNVEYTVNMIKIMMILMEHISK